MHVLHPPPVTGSVTIVKDAVPDDAQDFAFTVTGTGLSAFSLDDDADNTLSNTVTFSDLVDGAFTINETAVTGWDLTGLSCTGATNSAITFGGDATFEAGDTGVEITLASAENINCTFVNTQQAGSITIIKDAVPDDAQDFAFTVTGTGLSAFSLDDDADNTLSNTTTFSGLANGAFTINETAVTGWDLTGLSCTGAANSAITFGGDATFDAGDTSVEITLASSENITCTFVNTQRLVSIGNRVWMDNGVGGGIANNGIQDGGELGIPAVVVELYPASVIDPEAVAAPFSTATLADGSYVFNDIPEGSYFVHIPASEFAATEPLSEKVSTTGQGTANSDLDQGGAVNSDDGDDDESDGVSSVVYLFTANGEPDNDDETGDAVSTQDDNNTNYTLDFGFYQPVSIGNLVWMDNGAGAGGVANDGIQNGTELGVPGVAVELYSSAQTVGGANSGTTTTEADGTYVFNDLVPGDYFVHLPLANFTTGPLQDKITTTGQDAANDDQDHNGAANSDDGDDGGDPESDGLSSNVYSFLGGTEPTTDLGDADDGSDAASSVAQSTQDDNNTNFTIDFAVYEPVSLGNLVWMDNGAGAGGVANDGIQNGTEVGVGDVVVELYQSTQTTADTAFRTTATNAVDGTYVFDSIPPGDYFVHIPPSEFGSGEPLIDKVSTTGQDAANDDQDHNGAVNSDDGDDPANPATTGVSSQTYTITANQEPEDDLEAGNSATTQDDNNTNFTIDFGFFQPVAIGNLVWMDNGAGAAGVANNGIIDGDEVGVGQVVV